MKGRGLVSDYSIASKSPFYDRPGHPLLSNALLGVLVLLLVIVALYGCIAGR